MGTYKILTGFLQDSYKFLQDLTRFLQDSYKILQDSYKILIRFPPEKYMVFLVEDTVE